jgi:hypothetical protein
VPGSIHRQLAQVEFAGDVEQQRRLGSPRRLPSAQEIVERGRRGIRRQRICSDGAVRVTPQRLPAAVAVVRVGRRRRPSGIVVDRGGAATFSAQPERTEQPDGGSRPVRRISASACSNARVPSASVRSRLPAAEASRSARLCCFSS